MKRPEPDPGSGLSSPFSSPSFLAPAQSFGTILEARLFRKTERPPQLDSSYG
jgi:hypothetical protein